ncbi:liver-expressed antimicrobial peptide 2 isoform X2 [Pristis pectinata]|uniref:liver-expressed antimicrobial peptide 2 isoform X2 n=1 Tax=Pristis pectinata TaxID=685728 RepID=UPI00223D5AC9|nr:liver-expressed antimicrobial peptide 2 isoform X2 [Pristis pectinata]
MEARRWRTRLIITFITLLLICSKLDSMPIHNEGSQRSPLLRRLSRNTPFWRMITDSKPIQASCQNDYECSTKTCRDGQCTHSKYVS